MPSWTVAILWQLLRDLVAFPYIADHHLQNLLFILLEELPSAHRQCLAPHHTYNQNDPLTTDRTNRIMFNRPPAFAGLKNTTDNRTFVQPPGARSTGDQVLQIVLDSFQGGRTKTTTTTTTATRREVTAESKARESESPIARLRIDVGIDVGKLVKEAKGFCKDLTWLCE